MGYRLPSMKQFYTKLGVNVFMVSYRGYGRSLKKQSTKKIQKEKSLDGLAYGRSLSFQSIKRIMCVYAGLYSRIQVRGKGC
jgi:hypothetical protein